MTNLSLTVVFGLVSYIVSYFFVPSELRIFNLLAAIGVMGGYQTGRLTSGKAKRAVTKIVLLVAAVFICVASALTYAVRIQMGSANTSDIVLLGLLIAVFFFSLGFLFPIAGIIIDLPKRPGHRG
jgi:hypothetical protein